MTTLRLLGLALVLAAPVAAREARPDLDAERIRAHEAFLAGPELRGRASGTRDEAIAAAYVAAQFRSYGLVPAPGMTGFLQSVPVVAQRLIGEPVLTVGGEPIAGARLIAGTGGTVGGKAAALTRGAVFTAKTDVLVAPDPATPQREIAAAARASGAALIVVPESDATRRAYEAGGGRPRLPAYLADAAPAPRPATVSVPAAALAPLTRPGATVLLTTPFDVERGATANVVGYLPGTDPGAGVVLLSAHLDHLGQAPDGQVWYGANDDASGVVALLELARALGGGKRPRRGVLFVGYGSEERGGFGARRFADRPPVPLSRIVANIEFEMVGEQDPKLPRDTLMMTGYERSDLGPALRAHGALVAADPYPEQNFFRRSDNYALALKGVVAHTVSGRVGANYHTTRDTVENLDFAYMTAAIRSLVRPIRWLVDARFEPRWNPGGRPTDEASTTR